MVRTLLWAPWALLTVLAPFAAADVEFTWPKAGEKATGGSGVEIKWKDSGDRPALDELTTYQLWLCAGSNDNFMDLLEITPAPVSFSATGSSIPATIGKGIGASTPENAYFFRMLSTSSKGGTVTNFSPRFSLSGMTGAFTPDIVTALKDVEGTDGPDRIDATTGDGLVNPADGEFGVEYTMQTGPTRYAPMQPIPPTKITKKEAKPLHPTSAFTIATTFLPRPKIQTTITQSQTYSVQSRQNTAAPAPMPSDDMEKFLARWKD